MGACAANYNFECLCHNTCKTPAKHHSSFTTTTIRYSKSAMSVDANKMKRKFEKKLQKLSERIDILEGKVTKLKKRVKKNRLREGPSFVSVNSFFKRFSLIISIIISVERTIS